MTQPPASLTGLPGPADPRAVDGKRQAPGQDVGTASGKPSSPKGAPATRGTSAQPQNYAKHTRKKSIEFCKTTYVSGLMHAPKCERTTALLSSRLQLLNTSATVFLSQSWAPTFKRKDVSGPQPLCSTAFLDFTAEASNAKIPEVTQIYCDPPL